MIDAQRYREELGFLLETTVLMMRAKEYHKEAPTAALHACWHNARADLKLRTEEPSGIEVWLKSKWEHLERYLDRPQEYPEIWWLAAEAGLIEGKDGGINEVDEWLRKLHPTIYIEQAGWSAHLRILFWRLLRTGWEAFGEKGAVSCIKHQFQGTSGRLTDAIAVRDGIAEQQPGDLVGAPGPPPPAVKYEEGKCPACANPRCTGTSSFFHQM